MKKVAPEAGFRFETICEVPSFLGQARDPVTQLATLLFATDPRLGPIGVFVAASAALMCSSLLAVLIGSQIPRFVSPVMLRAGAGCGFIAIGIWLLSGCVVARP